jgi:hypothetical protein
LAKPIGFESGIPRPNSGDTASAIAVSAIIIISIIIAITIIGVPKDDQSVELAAHTSRPSPLSDSLVMRRNAQEFVRASSCHISSHGW